MQANREAMKAVADKGERIYAETIEPLIDFERERGNFIVIDVDSGDYEIDKRDAEASRRLRERRPHGNLYGLRVGFAAAYRMGGRLRMRDDDHRQG